MTPYYQRGGITIYHGRAEDVLPRMLREHDDIHAEVLLTDPPYPNNAGWFDADVPAAREIIAAIRAYTAIVFWSELEPPPVTLLRLAAVHIWHRTNVNGRPYEAAYHFTLNGRHKRSEVLNHPAIFAGAGPGCHEYLGHPTQKPVVIMRRLLEKTTGDVLDPFMGVGSTLVAAKQLGRKAIGIEAVERYCEIAANRLAQEAMILAGV